MFALADRELALRPKRAKHEPVAAFWCCSGEGHPTFGDLFCQLLRRDRVTTDPDGRVWTPVGSWIEWQVCDPHTATVKCGALRRRVDPQCFEQHRDFTLAIDAFVAFGADVLGHFELHQRWLSTHTPSLKKSTSPLASNLLRISSANVMLTLSAIVVGFPRVGFGDLDGNHTVAVAVNSPPLDFYTPPWTLPSRRAVLADQPTCATGELRMQLLRQRALVASRRGHTRQSPPWARIKRRSRHLGFPHFGGHFG